jgi:tryptophan-rich sensory protein
MKKTLQLISAILLCQLAGIIGSIFTAPAIPIWYATLQKPSFNPPSWLFGPVWITLYALMGIALFLVWQKRKENKLVKSAVILFLVHLILNATWSVIFFGLQNPFIAFIDILALWSMIIILTYQFSKIKKEAAYLLLPYLAWVSFAMVLNFAIWYLNN